MSELKTTIGLEIHVQLRTKSKMFCRCDNNAEGKSPNTVVCPICLGMPGTLPVTNKQAVLWTLKTGIALDCKINKIAKFDRKHYFYPDLPKGYQISQYDEPFCGEGYLEVESDVIPAEAGISKIPGQARDDKVRIRLNRIHLEEDAGKLTHAHGESLVDLNRAGTPLMEIVTEPDLTSPKQAGEFLRKLQKIVRDVVAVSEASMEKGHLRCDANISVTDGEKMSEIVEIKNLNSFRFVEKALAIEEEKLKAKYPDWPAKLTKETHGYNSDNNSTYIQRQKEEAADYRYFPEPDLPPFDTAEFDLEVLRAEFNESEEEKVGQLVSLGVSESDAKVLAKDRKKSRMFAEISVYLPKEKAHLVAKAIVQNYFGFSFNDDDLVMAEDYSKLLDLLSSGKVTKPSFSQIAVKLHEKESDLDNELKKVEEPSEVNIDEIVTKLISDNSKEIERYRNGEKQLFGFFMGQVMKASGGKVNPGEINKILKDKLEG